MTPSPYTFHKALYGLPHNIAYQCNYQSFTNNNFPYVNICHSRYSSQINEVFQCSTIHYTLLTMEKSGPTARPVGHWLAGIVRALHSSVIFWLISLSMVVMLVVRFVRTPSWTFTSFRLSNDVCTSTKWVSESQKGEKWIIIYRKNLISHFLYCIICCDNFIDKQL